MEEAVKWAWHQIVYEEAYGPLPEWADCVRHLCGVKACYEQDHLAAGHKLLNELDTDLHAKLGTGAHVVKEVRRITQPHVDLKNLP